MGGLDEVGGRSGCFLGKGKNPGFSAEREWAKSVMGANDGSDMHTRRIRNVLIQDVLAGRLGERRESFRRSLVEGAD